MKYYLQVPTSLVALEPVTGRSHQLRVHLSSLGCSILGDRLYSPPDSGLDVVLDRLALHAYKIKFKHPISRDEMQLTALIEETNYKTWSESKADTDG